jgi:XTP/dITP diphosphohydrolase
LIFSIFAVIEVSLKTGFSNYATKDITDMRRIVFATHNPYKIEEIRDIVSQDVEIVSLAEIGCHEELPETSHTLEGNALMKARFIANKYHVDCFADDTGLEVDSLNGEPGVYSARYAGDGKNFDANIEKLLNELKGHKNRKARFRTIIALSLGDKDYFFEGMVSGTIISEKRGHGGFGYDSVFVPEGYTQTFAEMHSSEKNAISHRFNAMHKLRDFLNK